MLWYYAEGIARNLDCRLIWTIGVARQFVKKVSKRDENAFSSRFFMGFVWYVIS